MSDTSSDGTEQCKVCGTTDFGTKSGNSVHGKCLTCSDLVSKRVTQLETNDDGSFKWEQAENEIRQLVDTGTERDSQ